MPNSDLILQRKKRESQAELKRLGEVVAPEILHAHVPRLASVQEARVMRHNIQKQIEAFSQFSKGGNFRHVAQIDQSVWSAIVAIFAKIDEETGKFLDDGLLYKEDYRGNVVLNRPFFYMLIDYLQSQGYKCDMRTKRTLI